MIFDFGNKERKKKGRFLILYHCLDWRAMEPQRGTKKSKNLILIQNQLLYIKQVLQFFVAAFFLFISGQKDQDFFFFFNFQLPAGGRKAPS